MPSNPRSSVVAPMAAVAGLPFISLFIVPSDLNRKPTTLTGGATALLEGELLLDATPGGIA